jgi:hypothetical protein
MGKIYNDFLKNTPSCRSNIAWGVQPLYSMMNNRIFLENSPLTKINSKTIKNKTMKDFVIINDSRIRKSIIKCYVPINDTHLKVVYTPSRTQPNNEVFNFNSKSERDEMVNILDEVL